MSWLNEAPSNTPFAAGGNSQYGGNGNDMGGMGNIANNYYGDGGAGTDYFYGNNGYDAYGLNAAAAALPQNVGKPKFGDRLKRTGGKVSEWHKKASPQSKQLVYAIGAGVLVSIIVAVCSLIFKFKKAQIDEQFKKDKAQSIAAVRENGGLPKDTLPNVAGELYERHAMKMMQVAQYHHDKAIKSTNLLYKHEEVCLAIGIIASLTEMYLPETIQSITNVHVGELVQRLNELKMTAQSQLGKISPLLRQGAPFTANAATIPGTSTNVTKLADTSPSATAPPTTQTTNQQHAHPMTAQQLQRGAGNVTQQVPNHQVHTSPNHYAAFTGGKGGTTTSKPVSVSKQGIPPIKQ